MEISQAYRFCPRCGAERVQITPSRPFRCQSCSHTSFFGPVAAVGAVITNELGQILLIERAREPGLGKLCLPGGFVDPNEKAEVALRREIHEEVGIQVGEISFMMTAPNSYTYQGILFPVLDIFFSAKICSGQQVDHDDSEVSAWMWTEPTQAMLARMAFPSNCQALECFLKSRE